MFFSWITLIWLYRSLDLTGPLLLGGIPDLPESFPVRNRHFIGCMRDFLIDNQDVDLADFIANNGTLPGMMDSGGNWKFAQIVGFLWMEIGKLPIENTWAGPSHCLQYNISIGMTFIHDLAPHYSVANSANIFLIPGEFSITVLPSAFLHSLFRLLC